MSWEAAAERQGYKAAHADCRARHRCPTLLFVDGRAAPLRPRPPLFASAVECSPRMAREAPGPDSARPGPVPSSDPARGPGAELPPSAAGPGSAAPGGYGGDGAEASSGGDGTAVEGRVDKGGDGLRVVLIHFAMANCHHCDSAPLYLRTAAAVAAAAGNRVVLLGDEVRAARAPHSTRVTPHARRTAPG